LSLQQGLQNGQKIFYRAIELFPLQSYEYQQLDYSKHLEDDFLQSYFLQMHECEWEKDIPLHSFFTLHKSKKSLLDFSTAQFFNLVYFDAFEPNAQPELWTQQVFEEMFRLLENKSVLVTYCSKGDVRRAMLAAGFTVEKLKGPPRKREMLRATKNI
jgi:tRNA U34 5-methylaminomethyl-2-thiouridine-forming methyltransferase MnmC